MRAWFANWSWSNFWHAQRVTGPIQGIGTNVKQHHCCICHFSGWFVGRIIPSQVSPLAIHKIVFFQHHPHCNKPVLAVSVNFKVGPEIRGKSKNAAAFFDFPPEILGNRENSPRWYPAGYPCFEFLKMHLYYIIPVNSKNLLFTTKC